MGFKDKLIKKTMGNDMAEMYKVSQSDDVQKMKKDSQERSKNIDWNEMVQTAKAAQAMGVEGPVVIGGPSAEQIALANLAQKLVQSGIDTPAEIKVMTPTGKTDATGSSEFDIKLWVSPADGEGYETTINQYLLPSAEFKDGSAVMIKVDPDDRMRALLWGTR